MCAIAQLQLAEGRLGDDGGIGGHRACHRLAPIDANSSSHTAATTTSPARPRSAASAAATMIAASPAFMS